MEKKRVIVHAGVHKTGTSALQAFFSANVDVLKKSGVDYPYAEPASHIADGVCSGNLIQILFRGGFMKRYRKALKVRDDLDDATREKLAQRVDFVPDERFFQKVRSVIDSSEKETVLLSGELFVAMTLEQMKLFKAIIADAHNVEIIIFVRDLFDFLYSAWRQVLKRTAYPKSFDTYCSTVLTRGQGIPMIDGFSRLCDAGLSVAVLNYDTFRKDIAGAFLSAAGIELAEPARYELEEGRHNRSLGPAEAVLVQKVNSAFARTGFPPVFTRRLMQAQRPAARSQFYSREIHQVVLDQCRPTLAALNERIVGEPLSLTVRESPSIEAPINAADLDVLFAVFADFAVFKKQRLKLANLASRIFARLKHRVVPWDFNPQAYLILNEDVARANQDPYVHYALFGRFEGRQYKYM